MPIPHWQHRECCPLASGSKSCSLTTFNDDGGLWLEDGKKSRLVFQIEGAPDWAIFNGAEDIDSIIEALQKLKKRMIEHDAAVLQENNDEN